MKTILIISFLAVSWTYFQGLILKNKPNEIHCENRANLDSIKIKSQYVSAVFWNLENLYDPYDDSTKLDNEFTPGGAKHWTWSKFNVKLNHIAKTLLAIGEWTPPAIIGMCEVENRYVLNKLIFETPLKTWKYNIVHHESPDMRGVDVALLYRPAQFKMFSSRTVTIRFPFDTVAQTREILVVSGILFGFDTLTVFINHWPSRRGGYLGSQPRRNFVASVLRGLIDSVQHVNKTANILVMGDFNDEPSDESLNRVLLAGTDTVPFNTENLYNLMGIRNRKNKEGTLKYRDQWSTFDQFVVSGALMKGISGLKANALNVRICREPFLLEEDNSYFGEKLKRTYSGPRYIGGFSDHLPIRLQIISNTPVTF